VSAAVVASVSTHINIYALSATSMLVAHFSLPIARSLGIEAHC
jgi:hypothetical protein